MEWNIAQVVNPERKRQHELSDRNFRNRLIDQGDGQLDQPHAATVA
jgi:hypothetical protein